MIDVFRDHNIFKKLIIHMTRPLFTHSDKWKMENKTIYFRSIIHQAVGTHGSFSQWNIPML